MFNPFYHFILAFLGTIGFAIMFKVPKKSLFFCGITGAFGWIIYKNCQASSMSLIYANLLASMGVSALSEIFARIQKLPVTCFVVPGIVVLVPGYGIYLTMQYLIQDQYTTGMAQGIETMFISGAIAVGIIIVSSVSRLVKIRKSNKFHV